MSNVCDYIKWRGDLELSQSEFNEIDNNKRIRRKI